MTREEAIQILADLIDSPFLHTWEKQNKALHMAIEALHREEAEEKGYCHRIIPSNVEVVVRCKDCRHQTHCHETVAHTERHNDSINCWTETIEWCSKGEKREPYRKPDYSYEAEMVKRLRAYKPE